MPKKKKANLPAALAERAETLVAARGVRLIREAMDDIALIKRRAVDVEEAGENDISLLKKAL